jgi:N-acetylmuramate 1-kinase
MPADLSPLFSEFLANAGWGAAMAAPLAGDASSRSYLRLRQGRRRAILMDATSDGRTLAFATLASHLLTLGLSAPLVFAADHAHHLLLLEDLGDAVFPAVTERRPDWRKRLYSGAIDVLATLSRHPPPAGLQMMDGAEMAQIARMVVDIYQPAATGRPAERQDEFAETLARIATPLIGGKPVLMLRDYHAGNLIWLPRRRAAARVGLLDFQDAMEAHPAYDLVSLLQDARRDVAPDLEAAMIARYTRMTGQGPDFAAAYAMMGAQRALRIIGIFARLTVVSAKPQYLQHMPRVWRQLQRNLAHPALAELSRLCEKLVPEPTDTILNRIRSQCPKP